MFCPPEIDHTRTLGTANISEHNYFTGNHMGLDHIADLMTIPFIRYIVKFPIALKVDESLRKNLMPDLKVDVSEDERAAVLLVEEGAEGGVQDGGEGLHGVEAEGLATI